MEFGAKLVALRKKHGLSQMELAEKLHISRQAISRWEVGNVQPSMDNIKALCQLFEISIDDLFTEDSSLSNSQTEPVKQQSSITPSVLHQTAPTNNRKNHTLLIAIIVASLIVTFCIAAFVIHHLTRRDNEVAVSDLNHETIQPVNEEPEFQIEW